MDSPILMQRLPGEDSCIELVAVANKTNPSQSKPTVALLYPTHRNMPTPISFSVTSYFVRATCSPTVPERSRVRDINIPIMFIESVHEASNHSGGVAYQFALEIRTKHVWTFVFGFNEEGHMKSTERILAQLRTLYMGHTSRMPAFDLHRATKGATTTTGTKAGTGAKQTSTKASATSNSRFSVSSSDDDDSSEGSDRKKKKAASDEASSDAEATPAAAAAAAGSEKKKADVVVEDGVFVDAGWTLFDEDDEMKRQLCRDPKVPPPPVEECGPGRDLRRWFHTTSLGSTRDYGYSPTYPVKIVVPNAISDGDLMLSAEFRSRQRVPAVSFVHFRTGAVMARSSQPMLRQSDRARFADATILRSFTAPYEVQNTKPLFQERGSATIGNGSFVGGEQQQQQQPAVPSAVEPKKYLPPPSLFDDDTGDDAWNSPTTTTSGAKPGIATASPVPTSNSVSAFATAASSAPTAASSSSSSRSSQAPLFIVDLRPSIAAKGNLARGGGWEVGQHYEFCEVSFCGIENIWAVINSFAKLRALVDSAIKSPDSRQFYSEFENSQWLQHIHRILRASLQAMDLLEAGKSLLQHCSDGWDRTSQCTSLTMLMLDPYYRTLRGFCILVEKEWCSFGHQFAERLGHQAPSDTKPKAKGVVTQEGADGAISVASTDKGGGGHAKPQDPSPIFLQWLDAVYQIWRQFPTEFEFTPALLEIIAVEIYSCMYGTFLGDHMKQRIFDNIRLGTRSLWGAIDEMVRAEASTASNNNSPRILNSIYDRDKATTLLNSKRAAPHFGLHPIRPSIGLKRLVFWETLYLRFDPDRLGVDPRFDAYPGQFNNNTTNASVTAAATTEGGKDVEGGAADTKKRIHVLLEETWEAAIARRVRESQVLPDIVANYVPTNVAHIDADSAATLGGGAGGANHPAALQQQTAQQKAAAAAEAKECWNCHNKFGLFRGMVPCAMCAMPFCSKCAPFQAYQEQHNVTGKLCISCHALTA